MQYQQQQLMSVYVTDFGKFGTFLQSNFGDKSRKNETNVTRLIDHSQYKCNATSTH